MNLAEAVQYFVDNLPEAPEGHDDILNECLLNIQDALGQPYGDAASIYFSGSGWYLKWCDAQDREAKKQIVFDYVKYELNHLPINTDMFKWVVTPKGYFFKVECPVDSTRFEGQLFDCRTAAIKALIECVGESAAEDSRNCYWSITADKVCLDDRRCSDGKVISDVDQFLNDFEM